MEHENKTCGDCKYIQFTGGIPAGTPPYLCTIKRGFGMVSNYDKPCETFVQKTYSSSSKDMKWTWIDSVLDFFFGR